MTTRMICADAKPSEQVLSVRKLRRNESRLPRALDTVARPRLMRTALNYLARDGMLALCSERGMGRHVLASDLAEQYRAHKGQVMSVRVSSTNSEASCRRVRRCINDALATVRAGGTVLVVAEGIASMGENYFARLARSFELAVNAGCQVLLIVNPEAEPLLDCLSACPVLRACDLAIGEDEYFAWGNLAAGYSPDVVASSTHGIPALVATLRATKPAPSGTPSGQNWNRMVGLLVQDALRPELIAEEQDLRCAMAALGSGSIAELEDLGVRVSQDILEETALMAPIFGANAKTGSFGMVPCDMRTIARTIKTACERGSELMRLSVATLTRRGNIARATTLASATDDEEALYSIACSYPIEMLDTGFADVALQALLKNTGDKQGMLALRALSLAGVTCVGMSAPSSLCATSGAHAQRHDVNSSGQGGATGRGGAVQYADLGTSELTLQTGFLEMVHQMLVGGPREALQQERRFEELYMRACEARSRATRILCCFAGTLALLLKGNITEAYRELMLNRMLRTQALGMPSVLSALLQLLYEGIRLSVGDNLGNQEASENIRAEHVNNLEAPASFCMVLRDWFSIAQALVTSDEEAPEISRIVAFHTKRKEHAALAYINLFAAFLSVERRSCCQAHVYASEAYRAAGACEAPDVALLANVAEHMALCQLGEVSAAEQLARRLISGGLKGANTGLEKLVSMYLALSSKSAAVENYPSRTAYLATLRLGLEGAGAEVAAIAKLFVKVDHVHGKELADELPSPWRSEIQRQEDEPALERQYGRLGQVLTLSQGHEHQRALRAGGNKLGYEAYMEQNQSSSQIMEVNVFGGLRVAVAGQRVPDDCWKRTPARMICAYLALKPGHAASRAELIEHFWPNASYQRGRENLYTNLSALRAALHQLPQGPQYLASEVGRIWLNPSACVCDTDLFEVLTRRVSSHNLPDEEIVATCQHLEELYNQGSFMPALDYRGFFKGAHEELAQRFYEAMVCGAQAARNLGDETQAKWFEACMAREQEAV